MSNTKTIMGQASNQYAAPTDGSDLFSTFLYDGTSASKTITNGLDLGGKGGLVWIKKRNESTNSDHMLFDTERGANERLYANDNGQQYTRTDQLNSFDSSGFTLGGDSPASPNTSGKEYVSWSFRKAPKFFDIVTYTGNSTAGRTVSHNLGVTPGMIIVKRTDSTGNWYVYHRGLPTPATQMLQLNNTEGAITGFWNGTAPTSTEFSVNDSNSINQTGGTFVAYLFAHNDGDGVFGPNYDQDIIKCGSYTGNASETNGPNINLGFEPQWVMIKRSDTTDGWPMIDSMRGMTVDNNVEQLSANNTDAGAARTKRARPTATGFQVNSSDNEWNENGGNYIYMAIRRGPLAPPTAGTEVFKVDNGDGSSVPAFTSGFPVDFGMQRAVSSDAFHTSSRLTSGNSIDTDDSYTEASNSNYRFDYQNGWFGYGHSSSYYSWMWKRAPSFCDVVCYSGNSTAGRTVSHNLGVAPEMIWVKSRNAGENWAVYHKGLNGGTTPENYYLNLDTTAAENTQVGYWNNTAPTASNFTVGTNPRLNDSAGNYISYLFSTLAGVSKVGGYTGDGVNGKVIDCGFTSGARFVLARRTDGVSGWFLFDSVRGITTAYDPYLFLNNTDAQATIDNIIRPDSSGFALGEAGHLNQSGGSFIFYAIA